MPAAYPNGNVFMPGSLASTAVTADQVILTYTVPAGKTLWLQYIEANVKLTTFASAATDFGAVSFRVNGIKMITFVVVAGLGVLGSPLYVGISDSMPFQAGDVLTMVCTPSAITPFTWGSNLVGYLK